MDMNRNVGRWDASLLKSCATKNYEGVYILEMIKEWQSRVAVWHWSGNAAGGDMILAVHLCGPSLRDGGMPGISC